VLSCCFLFLECSPPQKYERFAFSHFSILFFKCLLLREVIPKERKLQLPVPPLQSACFHVFFSIVITYANTLKNILIYFVFCLFLFNRI
jgi:hypothetical protein